MAGACTSLDLYDPETNSLTAWADRLWDSTDKSAHELLSEIDDPRGRFETFCDRYGVADPDALQRKYVSFVEYLRDEAGIPGRCPHDPVEGAETCLFHLPPSEYDDHGVTTAAVTEAFLEVATRAEDVHDRAGKCFAGARFDTLDLRHRTVDSTNSYPLDLQFSSIDALLLDDALVEEPIDLDHASVGTLSAREAHFVMNVSCSSATFGGDETAATSVDFERTRFTGSRVDFRRASFDCRLVSFERAAFQGADLVFEHATFAGDAVADRTVSFDRAFVEGGDVTFTSATFGSSTLRIDSERLDDETVAATVSHDDRPMADASVSLVAPAGQERPVGRTDGDGTVTVTLPESDVPADEFSLRAQMDGLEGTANLVTGTPQSDGSNPVEIRFNRFTIDGGDCIFKNCRFHGEAEFRYATLGGDLVQFTNARWYDDVEFTDAEFACDSLEFAGATFYGRSTDFSAATFADATVDFQIAEFRCERVDFSGVHSAADDLVFGRTRSTSPIDFGGATIETGVVEQPADERTIYLFEDATIGDLELRDEGDGSLFDAFQFLNTTFDGFNFGDHYEDFADSEWRIHRTAADREENRGRLSRYRRLLEDGSDPDRTPGPGALESTYMKAKNGADQVGDTKANSEFFQKELYYRRRKHGQQAWNPENELGMRWRAARRWTYNLLLGSITGYGEEPRRVMGTSILVIGVFVLVYEGLWSITPAQRGPQYESVLGSVILSLESFTTLVLGGGTVEPLLVRLFGYLEGFVGAFLIALFVFTLTRSIRR